VNVPHAGLGFSTALFLSLFGSPVRGEAHPESDIDVMVEFEPGFRTGLVKFESLVEELELLAGRRVGHLRRGIPQTIAVRHRIVHAYFDLDLQILWDAATDDIPRLHPAGSRHPHYRVCRFWTRLNGNRAGHGVTNPRQVQSPRDGSLGRTPGRGSDPECSISL